MAGYVHRSARARAAGAATALPAERVQQLVEEAQGWILEHRQRIRAGVPGCTCGTDFGPYDTWEADHAIHLARKLVGPIANRVLPEPQAARELVHTA